MGVLHFAQYRQDKKKGHCEPVRLSGVAPEGSALGVQSPISAVIANQAAAWLAMTRFKG